MRNDTKKTSKFLSLVLRHQPETIGLELDPNGWVEVDRLLRAINEYSFPLTMDELEFVVETNDKNRFAFSEDGRRIRASQGHSVDVDLVLEEKLPPTILFHGTVEKFLPSILTVGLVKGERHHVHLSDNETTATAVGSRRGKPVILSVQSAEMHKAGIKFYLSSNGVWLTDHVPVRFLTIVGR